MLGGRRHEAGSTTDTGWVLIEDTHNTTQQSTRASNEG